MFYEKRIKNMSELTGAAAGKIGGESLKLKR
jgi:hypothetical protein